MLRVRRGTHRQCFSDALTPSTPPMLPRHPTQCCRVERPLSYPMDGVAGVQLASSMLGEYFSIAAWTLTLSTLKGRGARLGERGPLRMRLRVRVRACVRVCVHRRCV